jgi:hypothetical protein
MPYVTGIASTAAALGDAITTAAVAAGWTWSAGSNTISKGTYSGKLTVSGSDVAIRSTQNAEDAAYASCISARITNGNNVALTYPLTYHIFITDIDIVTAVNYSSNWWQWLAFGTVDGMDGLGGLNWQYGTSIIEVMPLAKQVAFSVASEIPVGRTGNPVLPFMPTSTYFNGVSDASIPNSSIYSRTDGNKWLAGYTDRASAWQSTRALLINQPNTWNGESILVPVTVLVPRPSSLFSQHAQFKNIRFIRNDNLLDGQIIEMGAEKWFVAPGYRKNTAARDEPVYNTAGDHSGTVALAVRYDGA